jgi:hypothetical protein
VERLPSSLKSAQRGGTSAVISKIRTNLVGSAIMLIDVEEPDSDMLAKGAREPMGFYLQYGFIALPQTPRTVFKRISTIEQELG